MTTSWADAPNGHWLAETGWLAEHLGDPDLRIFDCTTLLLPDPVTTYRVEGDRTGWAEGHIPGAAYLNVQDDLSDTAHEHRFMLPDAATFAAQAGHLGIGDDTRVVLYSRTQPFWPTRAWFALYAYGFDNAMVLNGGMQKWLAEGRPVATEQASYPPARFTPRPRPEIVMDKDAVRGVLGAEGVSVVNALSPEQHTGTGGNSFGRAGRIAQSVNVPYARLADMAAGTFAEPDDVAANFAAQGATPDKHIVNYCGGGLSATIGFFELKLLGYENVALYDASMQEWAQHDDLPMDRG